jgi:DNA-binding NarL/FixJ family response regulator
MGLKNNQMSKSTVIIVDDHKLFRDGLKFILSETGVADVIAEASNGKEFLQLLEKLKPDLVLMDINMPIMNGIEASKQALLKFPELNILVLSMYGDEEYYNTMIDLGVKGFLLKDADTSELKTAINKIIEGGTYFSQQLLLNIINNRQVQNTMKLTGREKEILTLMCQGISNNKISNDLHISIRTVERHRAELLDKTQSANSISLVIYAIKHGLVKI